jgi:hypothetical protein
VFHDGAGRNLVDALTLQAVAFGHAAQHGREHFLISDRRVGAIAARERNAHTADDGDTPR